MKKIGLIIFISAIAIGVVVSNFFSFGNSFVKSPFKSPISISFGKVKGSGNFATQQREVSEFSAIKVGGVFKVEVVSQKDFGIEIEADDNIIPLIETKVRRGTLKITRKKRFSSKNPVKIKISAPNLKMLDISGVAQVKVEGIENDSLHVESSGASSIRIEGKTSKLRVEMSGASQVRASDLSASRVIVEGSGASSARLNVSSELKADLSGASSVRYKGGPENVDRKTSGASSVRQIK